MATRMEIHATWTREVVDVFTDPEVANNLATVRAAMKRDPMQARKAMRDAVDRLRDDDLEKAYEPISFAIRYLQGLRAAMTNSTARRRRAARAARETEV